MVYRDTTRFRERGELPAAVAATEKVSGAPTGDATVNTVAAPGYGHYESMTDRITDRFQLRSQDGELIFNPMNRYILNVGGTAGGPAVKQLYPPEWVGTVYSCEGNWLPYLIEHSAVRSRGVGIRLPVRSELALGPVIAEACTKAYKIPSDASLLVALAESQKTIRTLPDLLNGWSKTLSRINAENARLEAKYPSGGRTSRLGGPVARVAGKNLSQLEKRLEETWLAMRFGVRPAVSDTLGTLKALKRARDESAIRLTSRGQAADYSSTSSTGTLEYGITRTACHEQSNDAIYVRAMEMWEARVSMMDDLGVNLAHVPVALVDLTRFSFVLNWIINLNDFAEAVGAAFQPGWVNKGGCHVLRRETSTVYTTGGTTLVNANFSLLRGLEGHVTTTETFIQRIPGNPRPTLALRARPLDFLRDFRLLDAVTLLRQQTRGRGVKRLAAISP